MIILIVAILILNIIAYLLFRGIDGLEKEAQKKLYSLGKLRFVLIHCGLEVKREVRKKLFFKKNEVYSKSISKLAFWLQIVNIIYIIYFAAVTVCYDTLKLERIWLLVWWLIVISFLAYLAFIAFLLIFIFIYVTK